MMRKYILTILLMFCVVFISCSNLSNLIRNDSCDPSANIAVNANFNINKKRIAILPFINSGKDGLNYFASDHLAQGLMELGFTVVERQQLQALFSELKLDMSGILSSSDLIKIGQLSRIDTLVFGSVDYTFQSNKRSAAHYANGISLRFVDITTGEVILSGKCNYISDDIPWGIREICCRIKKYLFQKEE